MHSTLRTLLLAALLALPLASAERAPLRPVNLNTATATELMRTSPPMTTVPERYWRHFS